MSYPSAPSTPRFQVIRQYTHLADTTSGGGGLCGFRIIIPEDHSMHNTPAPPLEHLGMARKIAMSLHVTLDRQNTHPSNNKTTTYDNSANIATINPCSMTFSCTWDVEVNIRSRRKPNDNELLRACDILVGYLKKVDNRDREEHVKLAKSLFYEAIKKS